MYCNPCGSDEYRGLGIFGVSNAAWDRFKAIQGGEREQTDKGVIIRPLGERSLEAKAAELPPPPDVRPRPDAPVFISPNGEVPPPPAGPQFAYALPHYDPGPASGGAAPISVVVEAPAGAGEPGLTPPEEQKGFGLVEVAIGAGLAAILAAAYRRR